MVRKSGDAIGALAIVVIDNPMCPGTGHRICNDCMKACIYQKQEPVNIPQIETGVLTDVLRMPWGVEIYRLLTRWNPLNIRRPYALPYNGRNVLVVGLGPAGYTLAHYLLNEGFGVVAIDGLEDRAAAAGVDRRRTVRDRRGRSSTGMRSTACSTSVCSRVRRRLRVRHHRPLGQELPDAAAPDAGPPRSPAHLWRRALRRHDADRRCVGLGFDHIAIAAGAGRPTVIDMKNNLVRGVRKASDFLMALQLTGAFKRGALPNLQVRLPAVVIGGGLTGIDTATELFAYYPVQVEKMLDRYEALCADADEAAVRSGYDAEELQVLDEFLEHGRAVRAERLRAACGWRTAGFRPARSQLGRRDARLSQANGGFARVSPEPRRGHQGARRGHLVRRESRSARDHRRRSRSREGAGVQGSERACRIAGAHGSGCRRHVAERDVREGAAGHVPARFEAAVLPGLPGRGLGRGCVAATRTRPASSPPTTTTAGSCRTTATTTRSTPGTSSRRWRRPETAIRRSRRSLPTISPRLDPAKQAQRDTAWSTLVEPARSAAARACRVRAAADGDDRRSRGASACRGPSLPAGAVLSPAEFRSARRSSDDGGGIGRARGQRSGRVRC